MTTVTKIEISHRTIIFTVFFLIGLWLLYEIRQILVALFVSLILMSAINPTVDRLEKYRLPRWLAILLVYLVIFILLGGMMTVIITPLIEQTSSFINKSIFYLENIGYFGINSNVIASQLSQLGTIPANLLKFTMDFFSNLVGIIALFFITFYLLLERKNLNQYLIMIFGQEKEKEATILINKIEKRLGGWVRGELTLMVLIGLMSYIGLRLLGVEFALPLAILAGLLEILPNIGPVISAIPAILTGLMISPMMALAIMALYFLIHQSENALVAPKVMQKVVGLNPLVTILSLTIGFKLAGVSGAILAVPTVLVIQEITSWFWSLKRS
jgi:predicted PurR-regulated permease PerM